MADKGFNLIYNGNKENSLLTILKKYHFNFRWLHLKRSGSFRLSRNLQLGIQKF